MPASIVIMELGIFTIQSRLNNVDRWRGLIYNKQNLVKSQPLEGKILFRRFTLIYKVNEYCPKRNVP